MLQGRTVVGDGCEIGPDTRLVDASSGTTPSWSTRWRAKPRSAPVPRVGRIAVLEPGTRSRVGHGDRRLLHWGLAASGHVARRWGVRWNASRRSGWRSTRAGPTSAWPRRSPTTSAWSSATPTSSSSPTARCVPVSSESVRGTDVFIMQTHYGCDGRSINDSIMEQLIMIDAAYRASAKRITAVCPFYGYARQDRKAEGREPITARLVADLFKAAGAKRMVQRRPALGPDPGVLRRPGRPPDGHAGAGATTCGRTPSPTSVIVSPGRRPREGGRALRPAPGRPRRRPGLHLQARAPRAWPTSPWPRRSSARSTAGTASSPTT